MTSGIRIAFGLFAASRGPPYVVAQCALIMWYATSCSSGIRNRFLYPSGLHLEKNPSPLRLLFQETRGLCTKPNLNQASRLFGSQENNLNKEFSCESLLASISHRGTFQSSVDHCFISKGGILQRYLLVFRRPLF